MREKILVTGAAGFLGRALIDGLYQRHWPVKAVFRNFLFTHQVNEQIVMGEIDDRTDWSSALGNVQVVVHLAARVHVMRDKAVDPLNEFRKVNVLATASLARQAAKSGVKRFVFLSSVKVNGEFTENGRPLLRMIFLHQRILMAFRNLRQSSCCAKLPLRRGWNW